ncbi:adhesion G-protein coupled receptor G6-like [Octopus vulgaris]|uniref:Adhesion G-protein coupled receptor G6-like n=1 Tax=Octopus vulgaris TaxID=6645 RepID=A0AA36B6B9_OCTVU|nr:adhesion G-protein coupled receptor G6-like [Octopus vulgaris]
MVGLNLLPCHFKSKETLFKLCLIFLIHTAVMDSISSAIYPLCESFCKCRNNHKEINCEDTNLTSVPKGIPETVTHLRLSKNDIRFINRDDFSKYHQLEILYLDNNEIVQIQNGAFRNLQKLKSLNLSNNKLSYIQPNTFQHMASLEEINLNNNNIRSYGKDSFLFLPNIRTIQMNNNSELWCGCHLPALKRYMKQMNQSLNVSGKCILPEQRDKTRWDLDAELQNICGNYQLFDKAGHCLQCSGSNCSNQQTMTCPGPEPVCMHIISVIGITLKSEKSCSTYKKCIAAEHKNMNTCNNWTNGTSCVSCCKGYNCNVGDSIGWTHSFLFNLTITVSKDFSKDLVNTRSKEYHDLAKNISRLLEEEFSKLHGTYIVKVKYFRRPPVTAYISIYCTVLIHTSEVEVWYNIYNILNSSNTMDYLNVQRDTMKLTSATLCNEETVSSKKGTFHWPTTNGGTIVRIPCHANDAEATRRCFTTGIKFRRALQEKPYPHFGISMWGEPDLSLCYDMDWITEALQNISSSDFDENNIEKNSKKLLGISESARYFQEIDVVLSTDILEKMMPLVPDISTNITTNNILQSVNNMIDTPEDVLVTAQESNQSANGMLAVIERIPNEISLKEQQLTTLYSNLGIGVSKVDKDNFEGFTYAIESENNGTQKTNTIYNASYAEVENMMVMDFITLPNSLLKHLKSEELLRISRVSFHSLRTDKLYRVIQKPLKKKMEVLEQFVNSQIIAANIPNIQITNLDKPITMSFSLIHKTGYNPRCVYWDDTPGQDPHWSTKGCNIYNIVQGERISCSCNHLTSFALLMDVYGNEKDVDVKPISIISSIGCGISIVCLILTIIVHVSSKTLRKGLFSKILINLCIALAIANFIFLVGMRPYATKNIIACKAVAALLHYFLTVSIMWMAVEASHIYLAVVVVFNKYMTNYMLKSTVIAWGLPAIIVILTLAINNTNNYIRIAEVCWLSQTSFYVAFLFPVVVVLLFNLTIFSLIIGRLISMKNDKKFEHKARKLRLFGIIGVFFLLGLSWILAFFTFGEAALVFKYLFAIFNTLQGLFIFIFYCLYKKDARDVICMYLCIQKKEDLKSNTKYKTNTQDSSEGKMLGKQNLYNSDSSSGAVSSKVTNSDGDKMNTRL